MWLYIQPQGTVFFRDGRPFDAGADLTAGLVFPPYPTTCYGMLRTLLVHHAVPNPNYGDLFNDLSEDNRMLIGDQSHIGKLTMRGPFLAEKGDRVALFILPPADLYSREDGGRINYYLIQPHKGIRLNSMSDMDLPFYALGFSDGVDGFSLEPETHVIGNSNLGTYLQANTSGSRLEYFESHRNEPFWHEQPSVLIKRDIHTLAAQDHMLAFPRHIRMDGEKGLLLHLDDALENMLTGQCIARLGGEGRTCFLEKTEIQLIENTNALKERVKQSQGRFKAILTSPAYFPEKGYYPDFLTDIDEETGLPQGKWPLAAGSSVTVRLVAMAVSGRAQRIGGWNLASGAPKTMVKTVPPGSVYYFEPVGWNPESGQTWVEQLVCTSLPGSLPGGNNGYNQQGFNTFLIGGWDYVS